MEEFPSLGSQQLTLTKKSYDVRITNLLRFIYRKMSVKKGSLIDVGSGNGLALKFFKDRGFRVSGMERSKKLCKEMEQNPLMKGISIREGDILKFSGNEEYDYVLASDVIEHIQNDKLAIRNLFSFVKKGGLLIVSVPAHSFLFGERDRQWGHYRRYSKQSLLSLLSTLKGKEVEFFTYWNLLGFFVYFFYEKILHTPIQDEFRYKKTKAALFKQKIVDILLKCEEFLGSMPWGLTLIVGIRKV